MSRYCHELEKTANDAHHLAIRYTRRLMHRIRVHTAAGAFATLLIMIPWKLLHAGGMPEERAASIAAVMLALAAVVALAMRRAPFARKSFDMPVFRETFEVTAFLRAFASYAFVLIALGVGLWISFTNSRP